MPLLDLTTNLKSLKYGQDQPGGGNSGQPYQQVDINKVDSGFNRFRMTKFDDGLVRGGIVGAANASIVDTFRIGKFLTNFPQGPLWLVKQVGLQLANPKLETKKLNTSLPTAGQGFLNNVGNFIANTANKIVNAVGPTRIYNLGINTLAQVPVNAFGQHLVRHGLLPVMDDSTKYLAVAEANNQGANAPNNRLVGLKTRFRLGDMTSSTNPQFFTNAQRRAAGQVVAGLFSLATGTTNKPKPIGFLNANGELTIDRYIGGAQSVYGIGTTTILRKIFTEDAAKIDAAKNRNYNRATIPTIQIRNTADFGISNQTTSIFGKVNVTYNALGLPSAGAPETFNLQAGTGGSFKNIIGSTKDRYGTNVSKLKISLSAASQNIPSFLRLSNRSSSNLAKDGFPGLRAGSNIPSTLLDKTVKTYQSTLRGALVNPTAALSKGSGSIANYDKKAAETKIDQNVVIYGNSAAKTYAALKAKVDSTVTINQTTPDGKFTTINLSEKTSTGRPILQFNRSNDVDVNADTLAIIFNPLDPFTGNPLATLKFLAYLTDYSENYDSGWGETKYVGRAESFYIFNSFKRTVNVGFNIPCYNKKELTDKHCVLSQLASTLAGKYSNGLLGGIITKLKLGGYINNQPGIINSLTFSPVQDSSWDLDAGLAFYLKVSFSFTVIHNFIPQFNPNCGFLKDPAPNTIEPAPKPPIPDPVIPKKIVPPPPPISRTAIDSTNARLSGQAGVLQGQQAPVLDPITARLARSGLFVGALGG